MQVLAGAFPATLNDDETQSILATLLSCGIASFVCLQAEFSLQETEANWRYGVGLRPYMEDAVDILRRLPKSDKLYVSSPATALPSPFIKIQRLLSRKLCSQRHAA